MDFSEFAEFLGPIIFALIAWFSSYFQKKKKKDSEKEKTPSDSLIDDFNYKKTFSPELENDLTDFKIKKSEDVTIVKEESEKEDIYEVDKQEVNLKPKASIQEEKKKGFSNSLKYKSKVNAKSLRKKLNNKDNLKEAFVLKEILDRKY